MLAGSKHRGNGSGTCRRGKQSGLLDAPAALRHNHASKALVMRELPQTLIQVQTLVRALGMEKSMGLTKVHTCTWLLEDKSIYVGHRAAFMHPTSSPRGSYPQSNFTSHVGIMCSELVYKDLHTLGFGTTPARRQLSL